MTGFTPEEQALLDHAAAAPMLAQVQQWSAINSGSRNIPGLDAMAAALADAFSILPGTLELMAGDAVEAVAPDGRTSTVNHGRHLHLSVRPDAPRRILICLLYTSPSPRDRQKSRMPSSA